ncbi:MULTISPECIES: hypothetical protein [Aeromonas]|uniref:hypothetical protein n=1 Tax=Aeromonas TaxID=642 RepID=UPI000307D4D0|nr:MULTISPECIES: hypothetical protein [Aeromonas]AHX62639.1 ATPase [Aeromonas media WS]
MLDNYLNADAATLLKRLPDEHTRAWAWMVIEEIQRQFPNADHWTTGGESKNYIDLRIGVKQPQNKRGSPKLYLSYWDDTLWCSLHKDFTDTDGLRLATTPDRSSTQAELKEWFDMVAQRLRTAGIQLAGNARRPKDYQAEVDDEGPDMDDKSNLQIEICDLPLNQILFGPPGTGKTYHTINKALAILDPAWLAAHGADRQALKARFDALVKEGRIDFVTFHQSFSYEDFVEGTGYR